MESETRGGARWILIAIDGKRVVGSVQLALAQKENAGHRAEVQKLLVHSNWRRRGIARQLMEEAERLAKAEGRSLLVLDTLEGCDAERLYQRLGYSRLGVIPRYAMLGNGTLAGTVIYYKHL